MIQTWAICSLRLRQDGQGIARPLLVEEGEGLIEDQELGLPPRTLDQLLGEGQAHREHDLTLGTTGNFVQFDKIPLLAGKHPHGKVLADLQVLVAILGEKRECPAGKVAQISVEALRDAPRGPFQQFFGQLRNSIRR